MHFRGAILAFILLLCSTSAMAQSTTVLFDEDDATGADYREASVGKAEGGDVLTLAGPDADKMPVVTTAAFRGATSGLVEYRHTNGGNWMLDIATDGFTPIDLTEADSMVFYLNAPMPVAGPALPRFLLVDANGQVTTLLGVDPGNGIGYSSVRSGFLPGSSTRFVLPVEYIEVLPASQIRPGYPEDLRITFSDTVLDTTRAAIGVPAIPIKFKVETAFTGLPLEIGFSDTNGDSTLSTVGEFFDIYTPEEVGSTRQRPTWRVTLRNTQGPAPGDVYLLAVDNGGIDGDTATWQQIGVSIDDFGPLGAFDLSQVTALRFVNGTTPTDLQTLWVDYIVGIARDGDPTGPPPPVFTAQPGDSSVVLRWNAVPGATSYHVYRQPGSDAPFEQLTNAPTSVPNFADVDAQNGEDYIYILRSLSAGGVPGPDSEPVAATPQAGLSDAFLDLLQETAFDYFWQEANSSNGLVRDRSTPNSASSIAAVGFGLSAITVAIERGWITRTEGVARVKRTLEFFRTCPQDAASSGSCGFRGFFYHFLNMDSGLRAGNSELSTIDTVLLLGGVLQAGVYFAGADADETRIRSLAQQIYERVEWDWATPRPPLVALGWRPGSGFIGFDWRGYNEAMLLYILALGSPTHPLPPTAWTEWTSTYNWATLYGFEFLRFPPLFGHQYSHVWVDFRGIKDAYMREKGIDYFENSRRATLANRAYAIDNPGRFPNYGPNEWGLTASDDPFGYRAHGAPPAQSDNGTITPTAAGGSYAFTPAATTTALRTMYRRHRARLWGEYGFRDAYNIRENWFATDVLGIDQGPILLMIENGRTEAIWEDFMQYEAIQVGLDRAGFQPLAIANEPKPDVPTGVKLLGNHPNPFRQTTEIRYTMPKPGRVRVMVYNVLGQEVTVLVDAVQQPGEHEARFAPADPLPSGLYFYRVEIGETLRTGTMLRMR